MGEPKGFLTYIRKEPGTEFHLEADMVVLAMGFTGPAKNRILEDLKVQRDGRGNVKTNSQYMTGTPGLFAAGDMHRGQSLVVHAICEGRAAARGIREYLKR